MFVFHRGAPRTAPVRTAIAFRTSDRTGPVRVARTFTFYKQAAAAPVRTIRRVFAFHTEPSPEPVQPAREQPEAPADKDVFVREIVDEIMAAAERNDRWGPDYDALMARTRRSRSWCEKAVRAARTAVFRTAEVAI